MAQDKVAEIIKFTGAGAPPEDAPAPPQTPPSSGEAEHAGAFLAAAREAAGLSVEEVSEAIKVKAGHIAAIEVMRSDLLPPLPYASGFVKSYARCLGLDAEALAARFRAEVAGAPEPVAAETAPPQKTEAAVENEGARLVSVFAILAIVLFVIWVGYQVLSGAGAPPPAASAPRVTVSPAPAPAPAPVQPLAASAPDPVQPADETPIETPVRDADGAAPAEAQATDADTADTASAPASPRNAPPAEAAQPAPVQSAAAEPPEAGPEAADAAPPPARAEPLLPRRSRPSSPSRAPEAVEAQLVRTVAPAYPDRCARGARALESVTVMFDVSAAGRAVNARIVGSTNACFNDEALAALGRWRFEPRTVDGAASLETGKSATLNFRK